MSMQRKRSEGLPPIKRILVATDFSAQASHALLSAQSLADAFDATLILLHVIDVYSLGEIGCKMEGMDPTQLLREQSQSCMSELKAEVPEAEIVIREASDTAWRLKLADTATPRGRSRTVRNLSLGGDDTRTHAY